jgi:hypothetical protein
MALRRSERIREASYRPRTTWRLPEIVSVEYSFWVGRTEWLTIDRALRRLQVKLEPLKLLINVGDMSQILEEEKTGN